MRHPDHLPLVYLIWAAVLLAIVKGMMSAQVRLKQLYAILCYASLPGVIMAALSIAVMFMKPPDDFNLQNPLVFNPAAFMDQATTSKFVYSLASAFDLFTIWKLVLIAHRTEGGGRQTGFDGWGDDRDIAALGNLDLVRGGAGRRLQPLSLVQCRSELPARSLYQMP